MAERKQVMDIHANSSGITQAESNEQQRNWNDKMWSVKASDSLSNYDPTRKHLNFEVAKGGIIQPIDTSKSIAQKMAESLASRGIKDHRVPALPAGDKPPQPVRPRRPVRVPHRPCAGRVL